MISSEAKKRQSMCRAGQQWYNWIGRRQQSADGRNETNYETQKWTAQLLQQL